MNVKDEIRLLKNIVRIGEVSSVNSENKTARVIFKDKQNMISGPLRVVDNKASVITEEAQSHIHSCDETQWLPKVKETVLCLYLPNGESDGFILGGI